MDTDHKHWYFPKFIRDNVKYFAIGHEIVFKHCQNDKNFIKKHKVYVLLLIWKINLLSL